MTSPESSTTARGQTIAGVPVLLAAPVHASAPRPVVLWFHGFRADALAHAGALERCAAMGFLAVGVDAVGHGARIQVDLPARIAAQGALPVMLDLVEQTVRELPALVDALTDRHGADQGRLSIVGISMGAFLVYRAVAAGLAPRAAVALLGAPTWEGATSLDRSLGAFREVATLSITAEHDENVPPEPVGRLHAALERMDGVVQRHHVLRGAGHLTSADQWAEATRETMGWLQRHG